LVARDGASDRTPGGLYIPDTATDALRPARGVVLAVGRGHLDKKGRLRPLDVRVNDCVLFEKHAGSEIKLRGEQLIVLREKDVLGIVQTLNGRA
jgi:chaperonin GroES